MKRKVVIVEDEPALRHGLEHHLNKLGYEAIACSTRHELQTVISQKTIDVILFDLHLPDSHGVDSIQQIKMIVPTVPIIVMTAYATQATAIAAVRSGAFEFLTKPFKQLDVVELAIARAIHQLELTHQLALARTKLKHDFGTHNLVGKSKEMQNVIKFIREVGPTEATVLITGESGTGKELVAHALHLQSPRSQHNFVSCNCAALSESLLESELFGHVRGAFTGAHADKKGIFEYAHQGTLFLDEIGDMPMATQVKLLRCLQSGEIKRVGDNKSKIVSARIIAATNKNLEIEMQAGRFRRDLYYRIHVLSINLPPLRRRTDDIELLLLHFVSKFCEKHHKPMLHIAAELLEELKAYAWPGNIREFENLIERAVILAKSDTLTVADLPKELLIQHHSNNTATDQSNQAPLHHLSYKQAKQQCLERFNRQYITALLTETAGNITKAAQMADMFRSNFKALMRKYHITIETMRRPNANFTEIGETNHVESSE